MKSFIILGNFIDTLLSSKRLILQLKLAAHSLAKSEFSIVAMS